MSIYTFAQGRARRGNARARNAAGRLVQALLVLLTGVSAPWALAQPAGGGYANPQGAVQRQAPTEAAPVPPAPPIDMLATVRNRGSVRVCVAVNEPMVMHDRSGALAGYSIDLAERLAEDLGVKLELVGRRRGPRSCRTCWAGTATWWPRACGCRCREPWW